MMTSGTRDLFDADPGQGPDPISDIAHGVVQNRLSDIVNPDVVLSTLAVSDIVNQTAASALPDIGKHSAGSADAIPTVAQPASSGAKPGALPAALYEWSAAVLRTAVATAKKSKELAEDPAGLLEVLEAIVFIARAKRTSYALAQTGIGMEDQLFGWTVREPLLAGHVARLNGQMVDSNLVPMLPASL